MSFQPFTVRRTVRWGECDPAGIVYTPRFSDYVLEAVEDCFKHITGVTWFENETQRGFGCPVASQTMNYRATLKAGDGFTIRVGVDRVGRSSLHYRIEGTRDRDGARAFDAVVVGVIVLFETYRPIEMPADYREKFETYRDASAAWFAAQPA